MGRVKDRGRSWAGRMRCAREGRTDSRRRTWVAPESARMKEGMTEHNRGVYMVRVVVVGGIVRFQRGEGVRVRETRVRWGRDCSGDKREGGMREGGGCVEGGKGVYKNSGGY